MIEMDLIPISSLYQDPALVGAILTILGLLIGGALSAKIKNRLTSLAIFVIATIVLAWGAASTTSQLWLSWIFAAFGAFIFGVAIGTGIVATFSELWGVAKKWM